MNKTSILKKCSWTLGGVVSLLAVIVWASQRLRSGVSLSVYDYFPLLGLIAFSLMWTHYVLGSLRRCWGLEKTANKTYMSASSIVVLGLILLHPGLLNFQSQRDGFGLPPTNYLMLYPEEVLWVITLGLISLIIFLLFELKRWLGKRPWWRLIEYLQVMAMGAIFYHGLTLGRELSVGWYRVVWWLYGISLVAAILYNEWYDRQRKGGESGAR
jgi:hypothetical protein